MGSFTPGELHFLIVGAGFGALAGISFGACAAMIFSVVSDVAARYLPRRAV
jgi:uncharacterized membrane protein YdjX (TVP38/TMEM64 family)